MRWFVGAGARGNHRPSQEYHTSKRVYRQEDVDDLESAFHELPPNVFTGYSTRCGVTRPLRGSHRQPANSCFDQVQRLVISRPGVEQQVLARTVCLVSTWAAALPARLVIQKNIGFPAADRIVTVDLIAANVVVIPDGPVGFETGPGQHLL